MEQDTPLEGTPQKIERPSPLTGLANAWLAVVAVVFFGGRELIEGNFDTGPLGGFIWIAVGALAVIAVIALGIGLLQWRTTTFIVDDEFRIERRLVSRTTTRIDFTKVQSVDIHRPLAARVLGLAEVRIDVGGQAPQSLRFLKNERAESLRDHLLARMGQATLPTLPDGAAPGEAPPPSTPATPAQVVYKASTKHVLLGSFLSMGILSVLIAAVIIAFTLILARTIPIVLLIALLGIFWQVPKQLLTNWGFTISRVDEGLQIQRGALTRVQMTLRPDRVQAVAIDQSLLMRLAGLHTIRLTVLGNHLTADESANIDVLMPFGKWDEARYVLGLIWPNVDPETFAWYAQSPRGRRLSWFADHNFTITDDVFAVRHEMLSHSIRIVPHARVQGLGIQQGALQRLFGFGTVRAHTIDGPVHVQAYHLDVPVARQLFEDELARSTAARDDKAAEPFAAEPTAADPTWAPPAWPR
ncbi:MAG: PH domain-containing protein [Propionibacterium sp.]|nr:PH domain-containing protein [Propionibacterium sp.]